MGKTNAHKIGGNCALHPLIHTPQKFAKAKDVEKKKAETRTPDLHCSNQDIVARSQEQKWGLK